MNLEVEKLDSTLLENPNILKFTDLSLLGLYVYVTMRIQKDTTKLQAILGSVKEHFGLSDDLIIEKLKHINTIGFLHVTYNDKE